MKLVPLKCPSCSANLDLPADRESAFCMYCGSKILLEPESSGPDFRALLGLADTAYDAGNSGEALLLYNRVLEAQPSNGHAWTRKALCTLDTATANEMLAKYKEGVAYLNKAKAIDSPRP